MDTSQEPIKTILYSLKEYGDKTFEFLSRTLSKAQILFFLNIIDESSSFNAGRDEILFEHQQPLDVYAALKGLSKIRDLCHFAESPADNELLSHERAFMISFSAFHSGIELGTAVEKSLEFKFRGKGKVIDGFSKLLLKMLSEDYEKRKPLPNWNAVKNRLKQREGKGLITIVDDSTELISWSGGEPVSFASLRERLTGVRKIIRKEK